MKIGLRRIYLGVVGLNRFLVKVDARLIQFAVPVVFSILASGFEAVSLAVLTPFMKGFLSQDFAFMRDWPWVGRVMALLPESWRFKNGTIFIGLVIAVVASMTLKSVMTYISQTTLFYQARAMNDNLRRILMNRYLSFGKLYFDRAGAGQQLQVLMTHPVRIMQTLAVINSALGAVFLLLVYFVSLWMISWQLTVMVLMISPLVVYSQQWLIHKIKRTSEVDSKTRAELNQKTVNILSGIPLIQSQCAEADENTEYAGLSGRQRQTEFSMDKKKLFVPPVQEVVTIVVLLAILGLMSFMMIKQHVGSVAQYMVYFFILRRIMSNIHVFNQLRAEMAAVAAPIRDVLEVLDDKGKPYVGHGDAEFGGLEKAIEFRRLTFGYDDRRIILKDVNLTLPKGRMTAIVGPSGSGKSTIIQLLLRFYDCPPNTIFVDGKDIREFTLGSLRERSAWVSQETHLFNQSLKKNILFGLKRKVDDAELTEVLRRARLKEFVDKLPRGLETLIGERGVNLSGGEKQRVSIARAILKRSSILLLDEATSALDTVTESLIQEALGDLILGQTAVVVAHRLSTIRHADHVIYLEEGRVLEEGSLDALIALNGKFAKAWQEQKFS